jgi:muconate cycloisomerase
MRIRSVTPFWVSLPLTKPIKMATSIVATAENMLVRMEDTDGIVGWGEASSAPRMTGETPESMIAAVEFMRAEIEGAAFEDVSSFADIIDHLMYGNSAAKSALDMAAYDLAGKRAGVPVAELLGGVARTQVPVLWMLGSGEVAGDVAAAKRMADGGFVAFKVKVGSNVDLDLERCQAVRAALGPGVHISADANQGYSRDQALQFAAGAAGAGLDFIEQPVAYRDLEGMSAVSAATSVAIGTDEGVHSLADVELHHARKAARGASLKTIKLGGMTPVMNAGRRMQQLGMHVNLAGKIADSSVASAGIVQLGIALPQLDWDASITCQYLAQDVAIEPVRIEGGHARLNDRPGLGVEVDESKLPSRGAKRLAA